MMQFQGRPWENWYTNCTQNFPLNSCELPKFGKKKQKTGILYSHQWPNFGVKIPHTRFKITLYTVYPQTLADPVQCCQFWFSFSMSRLWYVNHTSNGITFWKLGCNYFGPTRSEPFLFYSVRSVIQERNCRSCLRLLLMNWSNIPSWAISFFLLNNLRCGFTTWNSACFVPSHVFRLRSKVNFISSFWTSFWIRNLYNSKIAL